MKDMEEVVLLSASLGKREALEHQILAACQNEFPLKSNS